MRRIVLVPTLLLAALAGAPQTAAADTLFGGFAGVFVPRGIDNRVAGDVLFENLTFRTLDDDFGEKDPAHLFSGFFGGGEVLLGLGDFVEVGAGIGYYQSPNRLSFYADFTDTDGTDILQRTQHRIVPISVSVRAFPIGRTTPVQPYVGGGVNFYRWNYRESGEFIDFSDDSLPIFVDTFEDSGSAVGPMVLFGVRVPIGPAFNVGGEARWNGGSADLAPELNFAGDKLDLGGWTAAATFHVRLP
jgi:hypothetical protein